MQDPDLIERLVELCLSADDSDFDQVVAQVCAENPEQAAEVVEQLNALKRAGLLHTGDEPTNRIPERLGNYRILERLGGGGMGVVYFAVDERLDRPVALKVLRNEQMFFEGSRERFRHEFEVLARLQHPGIVSIFEAGELDGVPYFTMEPISGCTLAESLHVISKLPSDQRTPGRLAQIAATRSHVAEQLPDPKTVERQFGRSWPEFCMRLIAQVAESLHYAHEGKVLHRDIKPSNILIRTDGTALICDFGLALSQGATRLTRSGSQPGSLPYLAPELVAGTAAASVASDVYALGVTLYELLTGALPYESESRETLRARIESGRRANPRHHDTRIPRDTETICMTAMSVEPQLRYTSAKAFADDLHAALEYRPIHARPPNAATRIKRWARRNPTSTAIASLSLAFILILALSLAYVAESNAKEIAFITDIGQLHVLLDGEERLWPAVPERITGNLGMDAWLQRANQLAFRLENNAEFPARKSTLNPDDSPLIKPWLRDLDRELEELCYQEEGSHEMGTGGRREIDESISRMLSIENAQHDLVDISGQVKGGSQAAAGRALEQLRTAIGRVAARRELAQRGNPKQHALAWQETFAWLETPIGRDKYEGLSFSEPIPGLIPIGPDPDSGLLEFTWLPSGKIAERDEQGKLQAFAEMGIVFVLMRGGLFRPGAVQVRYSDEIYVQRRIDEQAVQTGMIDATPGNTAWLTPFLISKYEITQSQWLRIETRNPSAHLGVDDQPMPLHPVEDMTIREARHFCQRLGIELPSEAQWEYAARSGTDSSWWIGNDIDQLRGCGNIGDRGYLRSTSSKRDPKYYANFNDGYGNESAPIGMFRPNLFGLHDTIGNVSEWCRHHTAKYIRINDQANASMWTKQRGFRSIRGGAYNTATYKTRSAARNWAELGSSAGNIGLRPVITLRDLEVPGPRDR